MADKRYSDEKWKSFVLNSGIDPKLLDSPIDRFIRKVGLHVRPVIYWNIALSSLFAGVLFYLVFTLILFFPIWRLSKPEFNYAVVYSMIGAVVFGIYFGIKNVLTKKKINLPSWDSFRD